MVMTYDQWLEITMESGYNQLYPKNNNTVISNLKKCTEAPHV